MILVPFFCECAILAIESFHLQPQLFPRLWKQLPSPLAVWLPPSPLLVCLNLVKARVPTAGNGRSTICSAPDAGTMSPRRTIGGIVWNSTECYPTHGGLRVNFVVCHAQMEPLRWLLFLCGCFSRCKIAILTVNYETLSWIVIARAKPEAIQVARPCFWIASRSLYRATAEVLAMTIASFVIHRMLIAL